MKIYVINGPNLNFVGIREKDIYGTISYDEMMKEIVQYCNNLNIEVKIFQSNYEGKIIDLLQNAYFSKVDGIIINAGAYTHYSYAIKDAIRSIDIPTVEVHLSNINEREEYRKNSVIKEDCVATFMGKNLQSYYEAIEYLYENSKKNRK